MLGALPGLAQPGLALPGQVDFFSNGTPTPSDIFIAQDRQLTFFAQIRPSALNEPGAL